MSPKTVFISYRRDSVGKAFARTIEQRLTSLGYDVFLDVDTIESGKWADQILREVPRRAHFLLLLTPGALDRCSDKNDWVRREFLLAVKTERNIVPVAEESVDLTAMRLSAAKCMRAVFEYQTHRIRHDAWSAGIQDLLDRYIPPHKAPKPEDDKKPISIDISRIEKYAPAQLIGREAELQLLSDAWASPKTHVLTFVALGGEGKTSLVAKWTATLAADNWPSCDAAFAWSFYSQGTREQNSASSDQFLANALTFFGDPDMANSPASAWDKGKKLAQLVGNHRSLLILDGLEPLQYPPTSPLAGQLKDQGITALLKGLAAQSAGLCVVTTRYSVTDLKNFWQTTASEAKLLRLSKKAGMHLLRSLEVVGAQNEFEKLVEEVKGHALTLNLLGRFLKDAHAGDIRKRDMVRLHEADSDEHAFHVMDAYVEWFESEGDKGKQAIAILRLLGLFDRPASGDCIAAFMKKPAIKRLTTALVRMSDPQRNVALSRLEDANLLTVERDGAGTLLSLDAHPLIREYFAQRLRERQLGAWRAGHKRLYEHLCATTKDKEKPTLDDLQPLYQAVAHGCHAGLHEEARARVYVDRILRGTSSVGFYSIRKLGAFGADLGAVVCFFELPWSRVSPALAEAAQAWLLNQAAFHLSALGRLAEAVEPMRAAVEKKIEQMEWKGAANATSNLSALELTLGDIEAAVRDAEQSVDYADREPLVRVVEQSIDYADRSDDAFRRMSKRTTLGDALHHAGRRTESLEHFCEAETTLAKVLPEYPLLFSAAGFQYCDLLLTDAERAAWRCILHTPDPQARATAKDSSLALRVCEEVEARAKQTLDWQLQFQASLFWIALEHLTLGRAKLFKAILEDRDIDTAEADINQAVSGLRQAGHQDHLPRGLITRAWLRFMQNDRDGTEADLNEAFEIAERGPMPLHMADVHLYRARLFRDPAELEKARVLIDKHGWERRRDELNDATAVLHPPTV